MPNAKEPTQELIIELAKTGKLTEYIFDYENLREDVGPFVTLLAQLHNDGEINLLSLVEGQSFDAITLQKFFAGQHIFCEVIPKLSASTFEMMRCVDQLLKKGGDDLLANQPNLAFLNWCLADPSRADEIIEEARTNKESLATKFLTFAVVATGNPDIAANFATTYNDERRVFGIAALGRMKHPNSDVSFSVLKTLQTSLVGTDDESAKINALLAAAEVAITGKLESSEEFRQIIDRACQNPTPFLHNALAQILLRYGSALSEEVFDSIGAVVAEVDATHKGTLGTLDVAFAELLKTSRAGRSVDLVSKILVRNAEKVAAADFQSFGHKLAQSEILKDVLVRWMLIGDRTLCDWLSHLFQGYKERDKLTGPHRVVQLEC